MIISRFLRRGISTSTSPTRRRSWWDHVTPALKDPINAVTDAFLADPCPYKINLGVVPFFSLITIACSSLGDSKNNLGSGIFQGAYRDDEGKPVVLQCVREAEGKTGATNFLCIGRESTSTAISSKLVEESAKLIYGEDSDVIKERRFAGIPALSGTGACRIFAEFQKRFYPDSTIYFPDPTWSNHRNIWGDAHVPDRTFHYYHPDSKGLNFVALMDDVKNAPDGSFFLLQPCAHNPTGVDPTDEQWLEISSLFKVKNHFPFFDVAYQGFASGDVERDAQAIRIFLEDGHSIGCAQSFAKNMGLYGHRVGCLSILCNDKIQAVAIKSQLKQISNTMYGSPPIHGISLVSKILSNPDIKALWLKEVKVMATRIQRMRATLREALERLGSPLNWQHITNQVGMFCFSGLTRAEVDQLAKEFHIYMTHDGRISMAGVTTKNVDYVARAIHEVTASDRDIKILHNIGAYKVNTDICSTSLGTKKTRARGMNLAL
ncbi:aspartate aminotransferase, mitochondrial-like isoform X1 [Gossypium arboreum]|uniref:aspartate aminotransferase, mitochondrial-like isoform X1 n=1 Tax=Gossypium arboreum TaxID=29729 RepID=UPI0022F1CA36|nr:aspartate aminotransferase, mitochondrial-like isoform X1 [Gossypium arboreum]